MDLLFKLFMAFFKIGAFTIGGGYAMLPLIQTEVVEKNQWLTPDEFMDILAIAEATPGPVAVNTSTYVGYKKAGLKGGLICTLGCILPSFIIILLVVKYFWGYRDNPNVAKVFLGIRPAVAALVGSAVYKLIKQVKGNRPIYLGAFVTTIAVVLLDINPVIIIVSASLGAIVYFSVRERDI